MNLKKETFLIYMRPEGLHKLDSFGLVYKMTTLIVTTLA